MAAGKISYDTLVKEDQVHSRLYYDEAIFQEEMDRIFSHNWVYVGHETEVVEPGEFVGRWIGLQPVILVRDRQRRLHLLLNRCRHRSNTVCQLERGNAAGGFRCAYHGWTYAASGELIGMPYPGGYAPGDFDKAEHGLLEVALEGYQGFLFGHLNPDGRSLLEHIGAASTLLDQVINLAPEGEVMLRAGMLKHKYRANWKMTIRQSCTSRPSISIRAKASTGIRFTDPTAPRAPATLAMAMVRSISPPRTARPAFSFRVSKAMSPRPRKTPMSRVWFGASASNGPQK